MSDEPQPIETTQDVGKFGGLKVDNVIPVAEPENISVTPVVGKDGGETTVRNER
ncbi:hypothetical protein [Mycolicibacterium sp. XJ870]